jgi:2-methylfumaryl-CoA isomerase
MYSLLTGLRVIEASSFVASPTCGLYLAQMGAEVIRVDQIGGGPDFNRWPLAPSGASLYWENLNRAKRSVAVNLGAPEGRELLQRLAAATGQFVTNFPVEGFLAHAKLAEARPDLITVRIMGQADGGTALDYTVNSAVGFPDLTGPGPEPVNHVLPAWDLLTGAYAAFALLAALRHRDVTGMGQEIRVPLSDVAIASAANLGMLAEALVTGAPRERLGNAVFGAFGRDFVTRDGRRLMILALTPKQWIGLLAALGIGEAVAALEAARGISFAKDEGLRFAHRDALFPLVEQAVAAQDYSPLVAALDAHGCCFGPYQSMLEAAHDRKLVSGNPVFGDSVNPSGIAYPAAGSFATIPQLDRASPRPAPRLGADTDAVLADLLGLSAGEIARLHDAGVVAQA